MLGHVQPEQAVTIAGIRIDYSLLLRWAVYLMRTAEKKCTVVCNLALPIAQRS